MIGGSFHLEPEVERPEISMRTKFVPKVGHVKNPVKNPGVSAQALLRKSPLVLCESGPPGHELPGFFQLLQRSWSSALGALLNF